MTTEVSPHPYDDQQQQVSATAEKNIQISQHQEQKCTLLTEGRDLFKAWCESNPELEVDVDDVRFPKRPNNIQKSKFGSLRSNYNINFYKKRSHPQEGGGGFLDSSKGPSPLDHDINRDENAETMFSSTGMTPFQPKSTQNYIFEKPPSYMEHDNSVEPEKIEIEGTGEIDLVKLNNNQSVHDPTMELGRLYRHTVELAKKLKESEKNLATVARQHEDRIEELQQKLEQTKQDLIQKKREIQDHKSKEKANLHQISALENEVQKVGRNLTSQKQLYNNLKRQYEEQCTEAERLREEAERLRDALRKREDAVRKRDAQLKNSEASLTNFSNEQLKLDNKYIENYLKSNNFLDNIITDQVEDSKNNLELELTRSVQKEEKTAGSDSNNEEPEIRGERGEHRSSKSHRRRTTEQSSNGGSDILTNEVASGEGTLTRTNLSSTPSSTTTYDPEKNRSLSIMDQQSPHQEHTIRKSQRSSSHRQSMDDPIVNHFRDLSSELGQQYSIIEDFGNLMRNQQQQLTQSPNTDLMRNSSRTTRKQPRNNRKRVVTPISEAEAAINSDTPTTTTPTIYTSKTLVPRNTANMAVSSQVNSTVTFALYTLVVYLFGIITSVFVLDGNQGTNAGYSDWIGFDSAREDSVMARSIQIILYWFETLLNDGNNMVPT
ncbi:6520_t:CDS:10 [Ambispora leptoticha]|uniref:6520_t:CDS:1 n=1 Tax=Ambispora leptoticha TaxID=144679 RepID=A0A9N8ZBU7_9GLOM|nr:6520_t:CDS:10 [Ambispora leptoticha]